jgi:formate-dependent nitrite reductase membrane component NrfD
MTQELNWGLPVISYLFLAGMGAGATCSLQAWGLEP